MTGPKVTPRAKRRAEPYPTPPDSQRKKRTHSKPGRDRRYFSPSATPGPSSFPGAYIRTPSPLTTPVIPLTPEGQATEHTPPSSLSSTVRSASPDSPAASLPNGTDAATPSPIPGAASVTANLIVPNPTHTPPPSPPAPTRSRSQSTWADKTGTYAAILGLWGMYRFVSGEIVPQCRLTPASSNNTKAGTRNDDCDSHGEHGRPSSESAGAQDSNNNEALQVKSWEEANNTAPPPEVIDLCDDSDSDAPELGDIDDAPGRAAARRLGRDACERLLEYRHQSSIYRLMRGATVPEGRRQLRVACYEHVARTFNLDPEHAEDIAAFDAWAREYFSRGHGMRIVLELAFGAGS